MSANEKLALIDKIFAEIAVLYYSAAASGLEINGIINKERENLDILEGKIQAMTKRLEQMKKVLHEHKARTLAEMDAELRQQAEANHAV